VKTLSPLSIEPDAVFYKRKHSALVGSGLDVWLVQNGIRRILVSGIRTEQCCETTARHASDIGYAVDYVSEATLTFAMTDARGRIWSSDEIKARSELVLDQRFARIATVEQALAGPASKLAA
jgi:nicotinamidase-related amidase